MELLRFEESKVVYLINVARPEGSPYLPEMAHELAIRYNFIQRPSSIEELLGNVVNFGTGRFEDVQIDNLSIYGDGVAATAKAPTSKIDGFLDDLLQWAGERFGTVPVNVGKRRRLYESVFIAQAAGDILAPLSALQGLMAAYNELVDGYDYDSANSHRLTGFFFDHDVTSAVVRRPMRFTLERRTGVPFEDNVFFTTAPLRTDDHLRFLDFVERSLLRGK
jgi:hypothetical protein